LHKSYNINSPATDDPEETESYLFFKREHPVQQVAEEAGIMTDTENFYQDLVESLQDLIVKFSPEGRLLYVNSAYCDILGKTREDLIGSVFMPVAGERYSDVIATQMTKLFRPPFSCTVEQWIHTPKGMRCISWSAHSVLENGTTVLAIVASGRDVTRIKHEQKATKKKDDELMFVLESGNQMYYSHTPDHVVTFASPRIRKLLGCRPHAGKRVWTDFLTDNPVNAAGLERTIRALSSGRREPPYRLEITGKDGRIIWVEVNEIPVVKNGKTISIVGSVVDITEKKLVEEAVAEAEDLFKDFGTTGKRTGARILSPASKGPINYFRYVISGGSDEDEDEEFPEVPKDLKKLIRD
jgi:PAS domain S-box-containing protein